MTRGEQSLYDAVQTLARSGVGIMRIMRIVFEAFEQATAGEVG